VASKNGVLRLQAEDKKSLDVSASVASPAAASSSIASPPIATSPTVMIASEEEKAFWEQLPAWLQAKIVARTATHQQTVSSTLPVSDAAHFACLPAEIRATIRARAAAYAEHRRAKLAKKEQHHRDAAAALHAKAERLLEKARQQEKIAAMKKAKLNGVDVNDDDNDDNNEKYIKIKINNKEESINDDATMWSRVPVPVKTRIVSRWLTTAAAAAGNDSKSSSLPTDIESVATFHMLPVHVQERVRARAAAHHHARHGGGRRRGGNDDNDEGDQQQHREQRAWRHGAGGGRHCASRRGEGGERGGEAGAGGRAWWRAAHAADTATPPPTAAAISAYAGATFENAPRADSVPKPSV